MGNQFIFYFGPPGPTTIPPTTLPPTTLPPTTPPTTPPPTTPPPTTPPPTTSPPVTLPPATTLPPVPGNFVICGRMFKRRLRQVAARAWLVDPAAEELLDVGLVPSLCTAGLYSETTMLREVVGEDDPAGPEFVRFNLPDLYPMPGEAYFLRVQLVATGGADYGTRDFFFGTT